MRVRKFDDRVVTLTEKEWRELLKRFDLNRVVENEEKERCEIPSTGCYLCKRYRLSMDSCGCCPLHTTASSCGDLVAVIVGTHVVFFMERTSGIWWDFGDDEEAREQIVMVYDALSRMKRVTKGEVNE